MARKESSWRRGRLIYMNSHTLGPATLAFSAEQKSSLTNIQILENHVLDLEFPLPRLEHFEGKFWERSEMLPWHCFIIPHVYQIAL